MKKLLVLFICLFLVSCTPKSITIPEENYQKISYGEIKEKINNDESFTFYLGQKSCPDCQNYLKDLDKYFKSHSDKKIYYLDFHENFIDGKPYKGEEIDLANVLYDILGQDYFDLLGASKGDLFTPSTFKVIKGEYVMALIGTLTESNIDSMLTFNENNIDLKDVTYSEVNSMITSLSDGLIYLGQEACADCANLNRALLSYEPLESKKTINYLDYEVIRNDLEAQQSLKQFIYQTTHNSDHLLNLYTPTMIKIKNNVVSIYLGDAVIKNLDTILS